MTCNVVNTTSNKSSAHIDKYIKKTLLIDRRDEEHMKKIHRDYRYWYIISSKFYYFE